MEPLWESSGLTFVIGVCPQTPFFGPKNWFKVVKNVENCFYDDLGENRLNDMDKTVITPQALHCIQ